MAPETKQEGTGHSALATEEKPKVADPKQALSDLKTQILNLRPGDPVTEQQVETLTALVDAAEGKAPKKAS